MTAYLGRRLFQSIFVLIGLVTAVFLVTQGLGDPARLMLPPEASVEAYQELRQAMGYDDPILVQFIRFVSRAAIGDFGLSVWQHVPVMPLVMGRLPATLILAFVTVALSILVAIPVGMLSATRPGSLADRVTTVLSLAGVCVPGFWLALMLILFFAVTLKWFPTSGYGEPKFLVLPVLTLLPLLVGNISQVVRCTMLDEIQRAYVVTARAKGLPERKVVYYHALKNVAIPVITQAGGNLLGLLNGTVIVETIFAWPGLGLLTIEAINNRDLPLLQGCVVVYAFMVIAVNILVDILYAAVDPRVRFQ